MGSKKVAVKIFNRISQFLKSNLCISLSKKKSRLFYGLEKQVLFLGMLIKQNLTKLTFYKIKDVKKQEYRLRLTKQLALLVCIQERQELDHIKKKLKFILSKILLNTWKRNEDEKVKYNSYKLFINDFIMLIVNQENKSRYKKKKLFYTERFLSTILMGYNSRIPQTLLRKFNLFQKTLHKYNKTLCKLFIAKGISWREKWNDMLFLKKWNFSIQLYAPVYSIKELFKKSGLVPEKNFYGISKIIQKEKIYIIVKWYTILATRLLSYYSCSVNFFNIKSIVNYQIRWALFRIVAKKHKCSIKKIITKYGLNFEKVVKIKNIFPTKLQIILKKKEFRTQRALVFFFDFNIQKKYLSKDYLQNRCLVLKCYGKTDYYKKEYLLKKLNIKNKTINIWKKYLIQKKERIVLCHYHYNLICINNFSF